MSMSEAQRRANKKYNDNKTKLVGLRLINEEYELLENYCKYHNISKSGLLRERITDIIKPE